MILWKEDEAERRSIDTYNDKNASVPICCEVIYVEVQVLVEVEVHAEAPRG